MNIRIITLLFIMAIVSASGYDACAQNYQHHMKQTQIKPQQLQLVTKWDKVFPQSDKVNHSKVTFVNRYGITLAADMFVPMASPDINTEDFQAAVDFLSTLDNVDPQRIGILGICGWGGMALNTAAIDTRIKATAVMTMYDMTRINANGYFDSMDEEARYQQRVALNNQRTADYARGYYETGGGVVDPLPDDAPQFVKDYYDYYKTPRGYHERSLNSNDGWNQTGCISFMNQPILKFTKEIRSAVLMVHGEKAHSRYFAEDAYRDMTSYTHYRDNKELMIIPGATHCDLYDGGKDKVIPWDKLETFFSNYLLK